MARVKLKSMTAELVSGAEVGRRLGVSREAVCLWRGQPGFLEPLGRVGQALVWDWRKVELWATRTGRSKALGSAPKQGAGRVR